MDAKTRTSLSALQDALSTQADLGDSAFDALAAIADASEAVRPRGHAGNPYLFFDVAQEGESRKRNPASSVL